MYIPFKIIKEYGITPFGVIHVGMHKGEEYPIYKEEGVDHILFVEAIKPLVDQITFPDDPDCHVIHAIASDKEEIVDFKVTNNLQSSSFLNLKDHAEIYPDIVVATTVKWYTKTLDQIINSVDKYKFVWNVLNIDTQGAELKVMKGLTDWQHIDAVFTEVNYREMYEGCPLIGDITEFLEEKGFKLVENIDTEHGWGDALYIRKEYEKNHD